MVSSVRTCLCSLRRPSEFQDVIQVVCSGLGGLLAKLAALKYSQPDVSEFPCFCLPSILNVVNDLGCQRARRSFGNRSKHLLNSWESTLASALGVYMLVYALGCLDEGTLFRRNSELPCQRFGVIFMGSGTREVVCCQFTTLQLSTIQLSLLPTASWLGRELKSECSPLPCTAFQKESCPSSRSSTATRELPAAPAHSHQRRAESTCQQQD